MPQTTNWNDIPDDILNVPSRRSSSLRSASRSSQSPQPAPAPLNFRPGRAPPRAHQPRRKSGQLPRQPLTETSLTRPKAPKPGETTWISPYLLSDGTSPSVYPLKNVAERVGREVEEFAEKLDKWKAIAKESDSNGSVLELVSDYRHIASETVGRLSRAHAAAKKQSVKHAWKERLEGLGFDQNPSTAADMDVEEGDGVSRDRTTLQDLEHWQDELNTWTLYESLLRNRLSNTGDEVLDTSQMPLQLLCDDDRFAADGKSWINFVIGDKDAREKLIVLKWLELISEESGGDLEIVDDYLLGHGSGMWSSGWLETRERLKAEKRTRMWDTPIDGTLAHDVRGSDGSSIVTQLDPDAITRQDKTLEPADSQSENALWLTCWLMLRRGASMDDIRNWLKDYQQFDKALVIGAHSRSEATQEAACVKARYAWRMACRAAAERATIGKFERAVVGLLCGQLESVQSIAYSWEDNVYGIANMALLDQYRKHLLQQNPHLATQWSRASYGTDAGSDESMTKEKYVASLEHEAASRADVSRSPSKAVQASIISQQFERLAFEQGVEVSKRAPGLGMAEIIPTSIAEQFRTQSAGYILDSADMLRLFTHILIIQRHIGAPEEAKSATDAIIAGYVNFLLLSGKVDAIPLYCSLLSEEQSPPVMARVLATITNPDQRASYTKLMAEMGINVLETFIRQFELAMTHSSYLDQDERKVSRLVLMETTNDPQWPGYRIAPFVETDIRPDEETIIRSMEWFEYIDGCWAQTFDALKYTAKRFLFAGRVQAAVELLHRMPPARVSLMKTEVILGHSVDIMEYEAKDADEEIVCAALRAEAQTYYDMDTLFAAIQAMWNWRETEELRLRQNLSLQEVHQIKAQIREAIETLGQAMSPVLQPKLLATPSIVGHVDDTDTQEAQRQELDALEMLRQAYLPEMILAYLSALYAAGEWQSREALLEALELTQIIANSAELTACFTKTGRTRELVEAFAQCSKKLLLINERERRGKKTSHERRLQGGRSYTIFEGKMA